MKAIYIDPTTRTIKEIECNGDIHEMYRIMQVDLVTVVHVTAKDDLWLDDEGLLKTEDQDYFLWSDERSEGLFVFAGKGLILGSTPQGETTDCKIGVEDVEHRLCWMDRESGRAEAERMLSAPPEILFF